MAAVLQPVVYGWYLYRMRHITVSRLLHALLMPLLALAGVGMLSFQPQHMGYILAGALLTVVAWAIIYFLFSAYNRQYRSFLQEYANRLLRKSHT